MMTFEEYKKADIEVKLKFWVGVPYGQTEEIGSVRIGGLPEGWPGPEEWARLRQELCTEAITEIQFLRRCAGAVSRGPDFPDFVNVKKSLGSPGTNAKDA